MDKRKKTRGLSGRVMAMALALLVLTSLLPVGGWGSSSSLVRAAVTLDFSGIQVQDGYAATPIDLSGSSTFTLYEAGTQVDTANDLGAGPFTVRIASDGYVEQEVGATVSGATGGVSVTVPSGPVLLVPNWTIIVDKGNVSAAGNGAANGSIMVPEPTIALPGSLNAADYSFTYELAGVAYTPGTVVNFATGNYMFAVFCNGALVKSEEIYVKVIIELLAGASFATNNSDTLRLASDTVEVMSEAAVNIVGKGNWEYSLDTTGKTESADAQVSGKKVINPLGYGTIPLVASYVLNPGQETYYDVSGLQNLLVDTIQIDRISDLAIEGAPGPAIQWADSQNRYEVQLTAHYESSAAGPDPKPNCIASIEGLTSSKPALATAAVEGGNKVIITIQKISSSSSDSFTVTGTAKTTEGTELPFTIGPIVVNKKELTVVAKILDKQYDGKTKATFEISPQLDSDELLDSDRNNPIRLKLNSSWTSPKFENIGSPVEARLVNVENPAASKFSLSGTMKNNYVLKVPSGLSAWISPSSTPAVFGEDFLFEDSELLYSVDATDGSVWIPDGNYNLVGKDDKELRTTEDVPTDAVGLVFTTVPGAPVGTFAEKFMVVQDGVYSAVTEFRYRVDKTPPTGNIMAQMGSVIGSYDDVLDSYYYKYIGKKSDPDITLNFAPVDGESGVRAVAYAATNEKYTNSLEIMAAIDESDWTYLPKVDGAYTLTLPTPQPEQRNYYYARITDNVGNVGYLSTHGVLIDIGAPEITHSALRGTAGAVGAPSAHYVSGPDSSRYYQQDVPVEIRVQDDTTSVSIASGIVDISARIIKGIHTGDVDEALLALTTDPYVSEITIPDTFTWCNATEDPPTQSALANINALRATTQPTDALVDNAVGPFVLQGKVDIGKTGDGVFTLLFTVKDLSGNISTHARPFMVDTTPPKVKVFYTDTEDPAPSYDGRYYFAAKREIAITVEDANFDPTLVDFTLKRIYGPLQDIIPAADWNDIGQWTRTPANPNKWTWSRILGVDSEGEDLDGEFSLNFAAGNVKDASGRAAVVVNYDSTHHTTGANTSFIICQTLPNLNCYFDLNDPLNGRYYNGQRTATLVYKTMATSCTALNDTGEDYFVLNSTKDGTPYETVEQDDWIADSIPYTYTKTIRFKDEGDITFSVATKDFLDAGHDITLPSFTLDWTPPEFSVEYASSAAAENDRYFNNDRIMVIRMTERNFDDEKFGGSYPIVQPSDTSSDRLDIQLTARDKAGNVVSITPLTDWTCMPDAAGNNYVYTTTYTCSTEAEYSFELNGAKDLAGNVGTNVTLLGAATEDNAYRFFVDKTAPTAAIKASISQTLWQRILSGITFGLVSNSSIQVRMSAEDSLCEIDRIEYIKLNRPIEATSDSDLAAILATRTDWGTHRLSFKNNEARIELFHDEDERFVYYLRAYDMAGNVYYANSDGMMVDRTNVLETLQPLVSVAPVQQPVNDIYRTDVDVLIKAIDPEVGGTFSSLKEVRYEVFSQGVATAAPVVLHSFILDAPTLDQIEANQSFETVVRVPAAQNNSNQVVVVATATDRAGNVTVASTEFKIDITPPAISVSYSNNDVRNGQYFKAPRVATISVRERNFDPKGAKISTNGSVGGWTNVGGEGDDTLWTCQISFASDNDYTLDVSVTDLAGNVSGAVDYGGSAAPTKFTVDLTKPVIAVAYDNNDVRNDNYYKAARTATISITEHNFSAEDVLVTTTAANGDIGVAAPRPGGWGRSGDVNTTAVAFNHDALYTITISATDLAGNEAEIYPLETFTVDTTLPIVEITGVEDKHAYNSPEVIPVVTFQDTNFSADGVTISLTGSVRREVEPKGRLANTSSGGVFNFENFPDEPEYDDVYTLHAQITDLAGNEAEAELMFSLNRYGSTYLFDEPTAALIQQMYTNQSPELNVTEVNVNTLSYQEVTYGRSGDMVTLNEGDDYKLGKEGSETTWKEYNYTVFDSNFEQDGVYNVTLYSEDEATNTTSNRTTRLQENVKPLDFTLDTTSPTVVVTGVADSTRYNEATRILRVTCEDNMALDGLELFLQDGTTPVASFTAEELVNGGGTVEYTLQAKDEWQTLTAVARDMAGNTGDSGAIRFLLTTNFMVQFVNNVPVLVCTVVGVLALVLFLLYVLVLRRRKKKENE